MNIYSLSYICTIGVITCYITNGGGKEVLQNGSCHMHFQHSATSSCSSRFILTVAILGCFRAFSLLQSSVTRFITAAKVAVNPNIATVVTITVPRATYLITRPISMNSFKD